MPLPAYPPDWGTSWTSLQRRVRKAYTAAQSRVRFAAVRAGGILVGGGGALRVAGRRESDRMMHVGADDEGGGSRLWLGRPKDGSAVLDLREQEGEAGQWALRDQVGNAVVAEGPEGIGLARPVMPVATHWITEDPNRWFYRNHDYWGPVIYAWAVFQHTAVTFYFMTRGTSTSGDVRLLVDGELIDTRPVEEGRTRTERFEVDGRRFLKFDGPVRVELQGRCHNDPGDIRVAPFYNEGAGTPPAPPE